MRAKEENVPLSQIYNEEVGKLYNQGFVILTNIPQFSSVKTALYKSRQSAEGYDREAICMEDLEIPNELLAMDDNFSFLLFDDLKDSRILVFSKIVMDFEIAVIISLKNIFPSLNIRGCNFHLNQCLWRKIQDLGLVNEYRHNEEIRTHLRMCASLAYIPAECVDDGWLCIQESSPRNARLEAFYDYFVEQWLENDVVTIQMWNCNEKLHRTNNIVEGWHHKLNSVIRKIHPKTLELIKFLKNEAKESDYFIDRRYVNLEGKRRKTCVIKKEKRIQRIMQGFYSSQNIRKCLLSLSYLQKFD
ncbi:uncharacterized protein LOC118187144 [Stegodyphus dumicola]|uniref:uncharacterized protein LOC118187144 n=1 Tax=Stegodyphus dumicola TaxID=202533 RepID=UPI0015B1F768|nr:uncharacterized protein LOC118187144 [Stegodyphus dumicola]